MALKLTVSKGQERTFSKAFAEARAKYLASGKDSDFTFSWGGKDYNVLRKGETKAQLRKRATASPTESKRPRSRVEGVATRGIEAAEERAKGRENYEEDRMRERYTGESRADRWPSPGERRRMAREANNRTAPRTSPRPNPRDPIERDRPLAERSVLQERLRAAEADAGASRAPETKYDDKSFREAFAAARKSGKDTFSWRGKRYTTETK